MMEMAARTSNRRMLTSAAMVAVLIGAPRAVPGQPVAAPGGRAVVAELEATLVDVIARTEPSVVAVARIPAVSDGQSPLAVDDIFRNLRPDANAGPQPAVVAAGVIIDPAGLVLTEYLAVREGDAHRVTTTDGKQHPATIRAADPRSGLAVLAIDPPANAQPQPNAAGTNAAAAFPAVRFGRAEELRKGQFVVAIGNPYAIVSDGQPTTCWGIVTNLARKAPPGANLNNAAGPQGDFRTTLHHLGTLIQTDAKLGWSTGGGALVNPQGELVGLTTTVATIAGHEQPAGYAIPLNATFRRIIDTLKDGREVEYGMLGVTFGMRGLPVDAGRAAVTIDSVFPGSPAERAGLHAGDVVTHVGGQRTDSIDALQLAVSALPPAAQVRIGVVQNGIAKTSQVTLAKLAVAGKPITSVQTDRWRGIRVDYATALDAAALIAAIENKSYDPAGCVLVVDVEPDSEAWRAGVRAGRFISHVGGRRVTTPAEFHAAARDVSGKFDIQLTELAPPQTE